MFYDLHIPFPSSSSHATSSASSSNSKQPSKKQQKKAAAGGGAGDDWKKKQADEEERKKGRDCWFGVPTEEREKSEAGVRMARHLGYSVLAFTQTAHSRIDGQTHYNPFNNSTHVPFPSIDPRYAAKGAAATTLGGRGLVQLSRLHLILDDGSLGSSGCGFHAQNTAVLSQYDILSVQPTTLSTFILACLTLSVPGPNQISIITLDFSTSSRLPFHLKRKPVLQALRLGVVFEILYSPLLPSPTAASSTQPSQARQTTLSTAQDLARITRGKGIIISSGGEGGWGTLRGGGDVVNLGTIMGLKANLAYAAVVLTPKKVVLRAQARKTFRGLISTPRVVVVDEAEEEVPGGGEMEVDEGSTVVR